MKTILRLLFIGAGALLGGAIGYFVGVLAKQTGFRPEENAATWMAVICAIHGAIMATCGWKYWIALGMDAADLADDESPNDKHLNGPNK